ncbi:MAG: ABC transporter ATP-binding protein [Clostridia bacterium]|nr:ABC transporter ATP-binding protein [Clostridia bacterium]
MSIYITENICREFVQGSQTIHALKNININIRKERLTILKGRSGSGKTTLMNIMGGLDRPTSGTVILDKQDITKMHDFERDSLRRTEIGFVFQSVALISVMNAYENVEFGLRVAGKETKNWSETVKKSLDLVGLSKRMYHKPHQLSGGEQQRVAIARAIVHRPRIVFADEPTAELDTHLGLQVVQLFKQLVRDEGITVIMTTHDPSMNEIADHVISLEDGEVVDET